MIFVIDTVEIFRALYCGLAFALPWFCVYCWGVGFMSWNNIEGMDYSLAKILIILMLPALALIGYIQLLAETRY